MTGIKRIAKMFGSVIVEGKTYVYDYANNECVLEEDMEPGSERHKLSERAKWLSAGTRTALQCAARGCPGCSVCQPK